MYVADFATALQECNAIEDGATVVAIDTEHFNFSKRGLSAAKFPFPVRHWDRCGPFVAVLQVSSTKQTWVFDIVALGVLPCKLRNILERTSTVKLVFDNAAEAAAMNNTFGLRMGNVLDLQKLLDQLAHGALIRGVRLNPAPCSASLASIAKAFLDQDLEKQYQRFNWRKSVVPYAALRYAAEDSMVLIRLMQFIAAAYAVVWPGRMLSEKFVNEIAQTMANEYAARTPASVLASSPPSRELPKTRVQKVVRSQGTRFYE